MVRYSKMSNERISAKPTLWDRAKLLFKNDRQAVFTKNGENLIFAGSRKIALLAKNGKQTLFVAPRKGCRYYRHPRARVGGIRDIGGFSNIDAIAPRTRETPFTWLRYRTR